MGYVVAIKRSARRVSPGAGRWVQQRGRRREFRSKDLARQWARTLSAPEFTCWVQDAAPQDTSDVDGYLVAARFGQRSPSTNGPVEEPSDETPTDRATDATSETSTDATSEARRAEPE